VTVRLRGLTWDHPRGYLVLEALANALAPTVTVRWHRQPLADFESRPLRALADDYDLLVIDHPGLGAAVRDGALRPLDDIAGSAELVQWRTTAIGASFASYTLDGRQWALPLDAAAQVSVCRPDLMTERPASWAQACQAARSTPSTLCLGGPHALLMFSAICLASGTPPAAAAPDPAGKGETGTGRLDRADAGNGPIGGEFVPVTAGTAALDVMADLLAHADRELSQRDPIGVLDAMATADGPAYCPLVYGYLTYQRRTDLGRRNGHRARRRTAATAGSAPPPHRLAAFDAPAGPGGIGSVLGGTGLAVTRSCTGKGATAAAAAQLGLLLSEQVQTRVFAQLGGQSAARQAWHDATADRASGGFYSATRASLEQAWVRPRFAGYPEFQLAASAVLRDGLLAGQPHGGLVSRVNELFARAGRP
jgi:multiple sugar transport system substrate-binding protein